MKTDPENLAEPEAVPLNVELRRLQTDAAAYWKDQESAPDLRQISLELAADEVFWMLPDSSIVYVNQSACEKLGYSRSELLGMHVWEWDPLFPREAWPTFLQEIRRERAVIFETKHRNKSGHVFPVEIRGFHVDCGDSELILAFVTDVTKRVAERDTTDARQRELEHLVRARTDELERFVYRTSHDLRAPLVSMTHLVDFILNDLADGDSREVAKNVGKIGALARRLSALVGDMLDLVKADLAQVVTEDCNLLELLEGVRQESLEAHPNTTVDVQVEVSPECPSIRVQRARLKQVLGNLVSNGIKYRKTRDQRSFVSLRCGRTPTALVLSVSDNGLGIPEEAREKIFERFSRFHPEVSEGSGLGLAIVKQHAEKMGATLTVESNGEGTTFTLIIPEKDSSR